MMVRLTTFLLAAALAFAPAPAFAQAAPAATAPAPAPLPDADPAVWVVRDADTTIYLFGTIHMLDGRPWFNDEVKAAFDASDELVMEAILPEDPASLQNVVLRYAVDPAGRPLPSRIPAEQYAALGRALAAAGLPVAAFDRFEPWYAGMMLAVLGAQRTGMSGTAGPETVLTRAAQERRMPVGELEGFEAQLGMLDGMPEAMQMSLLAAALEENDGVAALIPPMLEAWSSGDTERLGALLEEAETGDDAALHQLLFTGRNRRWAGWIAERLARPGSVFLAVGAGHLAGGDSVQAALAARGISAARVPHVEAD